MRRALVVVLVVTTGLLLAWGSGASQEPKKGRNLLMQMKLTHAQKVLEGVAVADFTLIAKNAEELALVSKKAEWQALKTPEYQRYSDEFRRQAEELGKAAKDKNLDRAALAYVQLTMNCVNCHKHVREVRMARAEPPGRLPLTLAAP